MVNSKNRFKKINLICYVNLKTQSTLGIKNKVCGQSRAFSLHNCLACLICLDGSTLVALTFSNGKLINKKTLKEQVPVGEFFQHLSGSLLSQTPDDAYYVRFTPMVNSTLVDFVASLEKPNKCVFLEVPTIPYEKELSARVLKLDNLYKQNLKGNVCAYFSPTKPQSMDTYLGAPLYRIHNGVDPLDISLTQDKRSRDRFSMIGVGWLSNWHGFDRVISAIASQKYLADGVKAELNIVGTGGAYNKLVDLCDKLDVNEHVFFHGSLTGKKLDEIYNQCHLAVGSLALYRLNLNYAETLKNREYLTRGMPILIGHKDSLLDYDFKGVFCIENNETEIDLSSVWQGVRGFQEKNYYADNRKLAIESFSWERLVKEPLAIMNG